MVHRVYLWVGVIFSENSQKIAKMLWLFSMNFHQKQPKQFGCFFWTSLDVQNLDVRQDTTSCQTESFACSSLGQDASLAGTPRPGRARVTFGLPRRLSWQNLNKGSYTYVDLHNSMA